MIEAFDAKQVAKLKFRVTYIAALVNLLLSAIKITVGILGQSTALIADGIHSLSDLVSDAFVIIAIKLGSREADHDHPYGHRRFETIATVLLGMGLIVIASGIAWDGSERILHPEFLLTPSRDALGIALLSILANEWLFQYTKRVAKKTRSKLLLANAWHHRSDAMSSVVVLIGVAAVMFGYIYADAIAAVIVALMVAKMGISLVLESIKELVDTSLPDSEVDKIHSVIASTDGVLGIHLLRTRQMGEDAHIDAHIIVDPRISVSEGHMIGDIVRDNLKEQFDDIIDVLVHIDPEDDEIRSEKDKPLPRKQVYQYLKQYLEELIDLVEEFNIHYLEGEIEVEVIIPHAFFWQQHEFEKIKNHCSKLEKEVDSISKVIVLLKA